MKYFAAILIFFYSVNGYALVPLESLLLGNFSEHYANYLDEIDPINYIFQEKEFEGSADKYRQKLALYRGFILEGENLRNRCDRTSKVDYPTNWQETQVKRSIISTLQYIGLDITIRALAEYGKYFEFSDKEFQGLIDNLVGNYCSSNLSVISLRQLRVSMISHFRARSTGFALPTTDGNPLFPESIKSINIVDQVKEQEFAQTAKLFRSFCSWGGDTDNYRLLVPLLNNPAIMSFIARNMSAMELKWNKSDNTIYKTKSSDSVAVICENLICRKKNHEFISRNFPKSMGYKSYEDDLERAFCTYFKDAAYVQKPKEPKIKKIIASVTPEDENLLVSQFVALLSGVPDFFIGLDKWKDGEKLLRLSVDDAWDKWADERNRLFSRDLMFEEQLTIEKVDRSLYFNMFRPKFSIEFDVNLGEFDRINQLIGKVDAVFYLNLKKDYLSYMRKEWSKTDPRDKGARNKVLDKVKFQISKEVSKINNIFTSPLWKGDMERLIAIELLTQLETYDGDFFLTSSNETIKIPVTFNFAPFALKYLTYKFKIFDEQRKAKKFRESLESK